MVTHNTSVSWQAPPRRSVILQHTIKDVIKLGTQGSFLQKHISAPMHTVVAIAIAFFDTCSYAGVSAIKGTVCIITLNFPEAYRQMKANFGDALGSVKMVVILFFTTIGGIFVPATCFGSLCSKGNEEKQNAKETDF